MQSAKISIEPLIMPAQKVPIAEEKIWQNLGKYSDPIISKIEGSNLIKYAISVNDKQTW